MVPPPPLLVRATHKPDDGLENVHHFWAFGKRMDMYLVEDHLVLRWGKGKKRTREYFQILVLSEEIWISDREIRKGLRRRFFGSADFMQQMHDTHCCMN